jgi:pyruvate carboxylase subunit A
MFRRILIANRGEVAIRIARTCLKMGIEPIGVYSEADARSLHRRFMHDDVLIGPASPSESYLSIDKIVKAAKDLRCEAIHPGYGFLAENTALVRRCEEEGLVFIGPPSRPMALAGDKITSRKAMAEAGVPVTRGVDRVLRSADQALEVAESLGYPVIFKASGGGGGIGMARVDSAAEVAPAFERARSVSLANFGSADIFLEKYVEHARHIEIQVFVDSQGHGVYLGERECSVQRRHQKLIEETPSPALTADTREEIGSIAVRGLQSVGYRNAGTVEFLFSGGGFHFNEVNARLQVEHPITEAVTGLDLVELQIRIAAGEPLPVDQEDVVLRGHAMECRINAEDPRANFAPGPGRILEYREPHGPGVRVDSGFGAGSVVSERYDPLIAKVIVHTKARASTIPVMERALRDFRIDGVPTTIPFHREMLRTREFVKGDLWTTMVADLKIVERLRGPKVLEEHLDAIALALAANPHVAERFAERLRLHRPRVTRWTAIGREAPEGGRDAVPARHQR